MEITTLAQWRRWLARGYSRDAGVWVVTATHGSSRAVVDYEDLVAEALSWGWVDSKVGRVDETRRRTWFSPRRARSPWSASNKERVERLIADGRMRPAGQLAIDRAKATGEWTRLDGVDAGEVPADLASAFRRHRGARANFDRFPPGARRAILRWIASARRVDTRAARVATTAELAARGERAVT